MAPPTSSDTAPSPSGSSPPSPPSSSPSPPSPSPPSPPEKEKPPSPPKSSPQPPKSSPPSPPEGNNDSSEAPNPSPPAPKAQSPPTPSQSAPSKPTPSPPALSPPSNPSSGSPPQQDNGGSGASNRSPSGGGSSPPAPEKSGGTVNKPPQSSGSNDSGGRTKSHDSPSNDGGGSGSGTDGKIIAGVAAGVGIFIIVMIIFYVRRRKKRKDDFYGDSIKGNNGKYYDSSQYNNNNTQQYQNWHQGHNQHNQGHNQHNQGHNQGHNQHNQGHNQHTGGGGGGGGGWGAPPALQPQMGSMGMPTSGEDSSMYSDPPRPPLPPPSPNTALGLNKSTFSYDELSAATGGFAKANILGQGGFGYVHKGVLPNGKEVAVKSLKAGSGQGEREFQAEVDIISRVHHRYLVSLVGYCIAGQQRMLVYEFVPNDTLEHHLHGKDLPVMDFSTRVQIAMGSAKGLAYLHEDCHPRIIHRDIKASNILLDLNFDAKVADFGLAKLSSDTYTHVSTRVMGTFGYLAPEYAASGKLTEKSDVFSFGVMLLELITGKRPVDNSFNGMEDSLVDWARPIMSKALEDGNFDELADPRLERCYNTREMVRMVTCAAASIRHSARKRPRMSQVVRALEGDVSLDDLNEGVKPGQSSIYGTSGGGSDYSQSSYQADMKKFRQLALTSEEFASSDYGVSSNESREMDLSKNPKSPKPIN